MVSKSGSERRRSNGRSSNSAIALSKYVPAFITLIGNRWSRSSSALYSRRFGIGIVEWRLMVLLAIEPWIQATRVDEVVGLDKGAVSRSARFLEQRGLLTMRRNSVDPRRREMALTPAGRRMYNRIAAVALKREERLLAGLKANEKDLLIALLTKIQANLDTLDSDEPATDAKKLVRQNAIRQSA